jgi:hypothetical protein
MSDVNSPTPLDASNEEFYENTRRGFRELFEAAKAKNELHFALSLDAEMRGMQDAAWSTAADAHRAFDDYLQFLQEGEPSRLKTRVALAFYCHLAEASGFYEIPKNLLRVADGERFRPWPFADLVQKHRITGDEIAPNANRVIKDLAGHAEEAGFHQLAMVFRDAFDSDIRNGYVHADYVVWRDELRLPKRNGGQARQIHMLEFQGYLERAVNFFQY